MADLQKNANAIGNVSALFGGGSTNLSGGNPATANFWEGLADKFTGNQTYARNLALQQQAQAFNALEA